uniref:Zinc finger protein unc-98 n=1 Tax=Panagrellus redivivus TaxID=6233 RepID=A0A7E4VSU0_PANRE
MDELSATSSDTTTEVPVTLREVKPSAAGDESTNTADSIDIMKESDSTLKDVSPAPAASDTTKQSMVKDENGFTFYKCRFCGLTYNYLTTLKAHERVHDVVTPYACNKCGESFHFACELEYHAKQHLQQKGYKCDCGRTFYQYTDLLYHKHPEDEDETPAFELPAPEPRALRSVFSRPAYDPTAFPTPDYATQGYEPKHPLRQWSDVRSRPYICQYCSKSYPDSRQLAYHMSSHRGERIFNPRASRYLMCRNENSYMSPGAD